MRIFLFIDHYRGQVGIIVISFKKGNDIVFYFLLFKHAIPDFVKQSFTNGKKANISNHAVSVHDDEVGVRVDIQSIYCDLFVRAMLYSVACTVQFNHERYMFLLQIFNLEDKPSQFLFV